MAIACCPFCGQLQVAGDGLVEVIGYLANEPAVKEVPVPGGIGRPFRLSFRRDGLSVRGRCVSLCRVKSDRTLII